MTPRRRLGNALTFMRSLLLLTAALLVGSGCSKKEAPSATQEHAHPDASDAQARLVFKDAPPGDMLELIQRERAQAEARGHKLVVYVGATWCMPCKVFHQAAVSGDLDAELPPATFLEFDADRDGDRIERAGYRSRYIPLFAIPGPDGKMLRSIEGSIKGAGAAGEIAPRLRKLVEEG